MHSRNIRIGNSLIGYGQPPYIIAEAGINHNGDIAIAKEMIRVAKESGANAVKFQTYKADEFCFDSQQEYSYNVGSVAVIEPMWEMFKRHEFTSEQWKELSQYADMQGITFLSTPQNLTDLRVLLPLGIKAIKVGSDDLVNSPLIREYARYGLPIILSTGMSNISEMYRALEAASWFNKNEVAMLICTSMYPTPKEEAGIARINTLRSAFPGLVVGFSDHTETNSAAVVARALGACIFEKHFTLDKESYGPDHRFSLDPIELRSWVKDIGEVDTLLGDPHLRMRNSEEENRKNFRRIIFAAEAISKGQVYASKNFKMGRSKGGEGLPPYFVDFLIGKVARRNFEENDVIEL